MKFALGQMVITPGTRTTLALFGAAVLLQRHAAGDWGDLDPEDVATNNYALENGGRLFSAYETSAGKIWIITAGDRSVTTVLLPEEY